MSKTSRIRDNNIYGTVANFLKDKIQDGASLSFVSAYFTINAFNALRDSLIGIDNLRFLFGQPDVVSGMDPSKTESKAFRLTEEGLGLRNELSQSEIAKECADWIEKKVKIKSVRKINFLHGKMYYIEKDGSEDAIIGSSNFTVRGLGLSEKASNIELNLEVDSKSDCVDLKTWFDNLWESDQVEDVTEEVLRNLANAYQDKDPEFIYYKTLYHLFEDFLTDATDTEFAEANPSFLQTEIWQKLYAFQKHGVQACIQKLKAYNGCIIADSVGLGKTYEALAIIKYFELRNANVLVLCPKKLEQNWTLYPTHYRRRRNPLKADRFRYNVLAHTDLSRERGDANGIDLAQHEWDGYDLVVIDESHNFRNRGVRYNKLMEDIIQSGGKTQVLMLSATPVNNRLTDLENQICLITEDQDDAFKKTGIPSIKGTLYTAQTSFDTWTTENERLPEKSERQESLAEGLNADFFTLLDRLTIARSRTHIINFYDNAIEEIGQFPDRELLQPIFPKIDIQGKFPTYQAISNQIDNYQLAIFNPSRYIRKECRHHYGERLLQQREFNLIGMMKVNFLKRLESSVYSFATTLKRTIKDIKALEADIDNFVNSTTSTDKRSGFDSLAETPEEYGEDDDLQNLQDCDYVVNYDIHWNPVRIIQRFGRIDRIGSKNEKIYLVNFWPTPELDEYINLKPRVEARMALVNLTATGDDDLLSLKEKESMEQVWTHRDEQLRRMQTDILDFEDIEEQLNLNQFTLDDFRAQLLNYLQGKETELKNAPLGLYAVTAPRKHDGTPLNIKPGVIFCLRQTSEGEDNEGGEKLNPIHPYYLVHISDEGEVSIGFTNPKHILERFSTLCVKKTNYDQDLCHWFNAETNNGKDMTVYEMLLDIALDSIREAYNRKVNDHLDASADALLPTADSQITEKTEFELVTWLVIGR